MWIYRIVQPETPTLVGSIVDGVLVLVPPSNTTIPVRSVLFTDTDVVGVGDIISVVEGVREGDWTQVAFGVAGGARDDRF